MANNYTVQLKNATPELIEAVEKRGYSLPRSFHYQKDARSLTYRLIRDFQDLDIYVECVGRGRCRGWESFMLRRPKQPIPMNVSTD